MLSEDDELIDVEREILAAEEKLNEDKKDKFKNQKEKNDIEFVKQTNPVESNGYKNKLIKVYEDLELLNKSDLERQIEEIRKELKQIILELEESEKKISQQVSNFVDDKIKQDNDLHYMIPYKKKIIKEGNERVFTPLTISFLILSIVLFTVVLVMLYVMK